jgi:hypothetical protein
MSKARDLANAGTALTTVSATELGYLDGVTSAVQTQINAKEATLPDQTGNTGKYLTTNGTAKSWGTVSQYALPSQTGNSGKFLTTNGTTESWGTVNQPITWTNRLISTQVGFNQIAYNGTNLWVAVGSGGQLYRSSDGITWTQTTSGFSSNTIRDVAFGNNLWVAVGQNGTITTSTDGITWTARTSNMGSNQINAVAYANSVWVAVGAGGGGTNTGGITYSSDGITWTRKNQTNTVGQNYQCVVYNGTNWIVGSNTSTNNYLYASTPSGTWTQGVTNTQGQINWIIWDGTRHTFSEDGQMKYSLSSTFATRVVYTNFTSQTNIGAHKLYNGKIYGTGYYAFNYTPTNNEVVSDFSFSLSPTNMPTSGGSGITSIPTAVWSGAQGIILVDDYGRIYTSF